MSNDLSIKVSEVLGKSKFQIKVGDKLVNLIGTTEEYKNKLLKETKHFLGTSRRDWNYLNTEIILKNPTNTIAVDKANSISKRIGRLENEIKLIVESFTVDNQKCESLTLFPIGKEDEIVLSSNNILDKVIESDFAAFEKKMYEILCAGDSDVVVPVLKNISERFGFRLSKIPKK